MNMRENLNDLQAFVMVARAGSFTKAAAQLGVSQSALSHTIRALEQRLDIRLLTRTTRSVSPTEAGAQLLETIGPRFDEIAAGLDALGDWHGKLSANIRITAAAHAAETVLWPKLAQFLPDYSGIKVEINIQYGLTNIVAERYDAGVRLGEQVAKDMIAVRIGPDWRMRVVGAPAYFSRHTKPQTPQDLSAHNCINLRLPTYDSMLPWELEQNGHKINARVDGQLAFNDSHMMLEAALAGFGLTYLPEDMVAPHLADGRLISVLDDWCQPFSGYHLYYPSRRQSSAAFQLMVEALRYQPDEA